MNRITLADLNGVIGRLNQITDSPDEPAGWECGWCGNFYIEPADDDYAYEESRQLEIDDEV